MPDQAKNVLIGIFVIAASAIMIFLLLFIHPSTGNEGRLLRVRFVDIDKISIGTRVTFGGKPVGEVTDIQELPDVEIERKVVNGYVYTYELTLKVDTGVNVFNVDSIITRTSGLLGERSVAIIPGAPKSGEPVFIVNDEVIYAKETGTVEETLTEFKSLTTKIDITLDNFNNALTKLDEQKFWDNLSGTAANINDITKSLNKPEQWSDILANVHTVTTNLKTSWPKIEDSINNFKSFSSNFQSFSASLNSEKGTVGRLVKNDDLYLRMTALFSKADTVMNDIEHYGILFHLDKHWQRLRARRMNLMQKLSTPQEFRNYFNDELDQIETSLSRVATVLNQYDWQPPYCYYNLLDNPEYKKVFAELLRKVSALEEEVKLYNIQAVDRADAETELINNENCCR